MDSILVQNIELISVPIQVNTEIRISRFRNLVWDSMTTVRNYL